MASLWHDSPCHKACYWNEIDDLRALLEGDSGDDDADATRLLLVNAAGRDGWTALHTASFMNRLEAAELLLRAGAAVGSVTVSGQLTALHLACHRGHGDMAALLLRFMKGEGGVSSRCSDAANPSGGGFLNSPKNRRYC